MASIEIPIVDAQTKVQGGSESSMLHIFMSLTDSFIYIYIFIHFQTLHLVYSLMKVHNFYE